MSELVTKSLAQIVNINHRAASVFEKYHLDFCCKGKRPLWQACEENQVSLEEVVAELEKTASVNSCSIPVNYENFTLAQLAGYIEMTHHSYVKKEMPAIMGYLGKVAGKHGDRHPEMIKVFRLFTELKEEMDRHLQTEETVLFPRIKEMEKALLAGSKIPVANSGLPDPIMIMELEHDDAGNKLSEIRKLTNNYNPPADACTTYRLCYAALEAFELDLHAHIHLENNILFPRALQMIPLSPAASLN
ncbi:MAG: iron-sulfur cluster repair di-iron protein [Chitinophagaceae bacterium]